MSKRRLEELRSAQTCYGALVLGIATRVFPLLKRSVWLEGTPMKRAASIYDVARLAGVSTSTVSNVLNNKGRASKETTERVLAIARDCGYVPSFAAKSLRGQRTNSIGIITPDVSNEFYSSIVLQVETGLHRAGFDSYICNSSNNASRELDYVHGLLQKRVDGFVLAGGTADIASDTLGTDIPAVLVDRPKGTVADCPKHISVGNDIHALVGTMVNTLVSHGCERIVYINVSTRRKDAAGKARYEAYSDALRDAGLTLNQHLVLEAPHREKSYVEAERALNKLIASHEHFDGVVCMGDRVALGVSEALKRNGMLPGRHVLTIGMDDAMSSRIASPTISSVQRHTDKMADAAVNALLSLIKGEETPDVVIPFEVIERETTLGLRGI